MFSRENGGFDAFVGNPPFLGGKRIKTSLGERFRDWLAVLHDASNSNSDLIAHFFRRVFTLLGEGAFGLIATNTVAQGDTRDTGVKWIRDQGGIIYNARKRVRWPGQAAVVVSVLHVAKKRVPAAHEIDGKKVNQITSYLLPNGGDEAPQRLHANEGGCYIGCFLRGMGFTFDDADTSGAANPLALRTELIQQDPRNSELIFPFLGGQEVNSSPTHAAHRFTINFGASSLEEASKWPDLLDVVRNKVKPERDRLGNSSIDRSHKENWWRVANERPELMAAKEGLKRVLACGIISNKISFVFLP